ncbi:MAG: prepilin peptidase, partial [Nevskiales bacterium]
MVSVETFLLPSAYLPIAGILGLLVGSFLNVVITRLPQMMEAAWKRECASLNGDQTEAQADKLSLAWPPSRCNHCKAPIRAWQNIPVISYLLLRGRCASCQKSISLQYPLVELLSAGFTVLALWRFGLGTAGIAAVLLSWGLLAASFIDLRTRLLPDDITLPFLWLGLLLNTAGVFTDLGSAVIGAAAGYMSLWLIHHGFRLLTGKEGMGYGDFKLFALFGAWLGWQQLPMIVLLSSLVGAIAGGILLA